MSSRTKGIMQFPAHSRFPTNDNAARKRSDPDVKTYITRFNDDEWKLHNIQRNDSTWKDPEYALTIQSIFEGSMLSPFIASLQENGIDTFLIDGGHRTRAILRFMNDEFPVKIWRTGETSLYSELEERDRKKFLSTEINVITWTKLTKLDEETLFFRVNIGLCLSGGEAVNAYHTIPMCVLARELAEQYDDILHDSIDRAILRNNDRHDASSWMFLILANFHHHEIVRGENYGPSKFEDQKKECEKFRGVALNLNLETRVKFLMHILSNKTHKDKYPSYVIPTVQEIMILEMNRMADAGPIAPAGTSAGLLKLIDRFLFDMFLEPVTGLPSDELKIEWNGYGRGVVSNPGNPGICRKRAKIFFNWKQYHQISSGFDLHRE
jgi:hypothetical protein